MMLAAFAAVGGIASTYINMIGDFFQSLFGFAGATQWVAGLLIMVCTKRALVRAIMETLLKRTWLFLVISIENEKKGEMKNKNKNGTGNTCHLSYIIDHCVQLGSQS